MGLLLRVILVVLLITLVRFVLTRIFGTGRRRAGAASAKRFTGRPRTIQGRMVKDPQCGIYVASELALPARSGSTTLHFCSAQCRDEYFRTHTVKSAAAP